VKANNDSQNTHPHPLWRRKMEEGGGDKRFFYRYMPPLVARQKTKNNATM